MKQPQTLDEISSIQWTLYEWIEVTKECDQHRTFIRGKERTPDEAAKASEDFDVWLMARRAELALLSHRAHSALQAKGAT